MLADAVLHAIHMSSHYSHFQDGKLSLKMCNGLSASPVSRWAEVPSLTGEMESWE